MIGAVGSIGRLMSTSALTRFVGALDGLQALRAYSVRKLYSNYTGACVRVRRTSDGAQTDIGFKLYAFRAYAYWIDEEALLAFAGGSSLTIVYWYDQSGNDGHAEQSNAALQPRIVNAGVIETINGLPAIVHYQTSTVSSLLLANFTVGSQNDLTVISVAKAAPVVGISSYPEIAGFTNTNGNKLFGFVRFNTQNRFFSPPTTSYQSILVTANVGFVATVAKTAAGKKMILNGGAPIEENNATTQASQTPQGFGILGGYVADAGTNLAISEAIGFIGFLSDTTRQAIERGQGAAFGITVA